jgi:two-component system NtrC family sensor kinase
MSGVRAQISGALFIVLTVATAVCALINFQQQSKYRLPDDGAVWSERRENGLTRVEAVWVNEGGPAFRAGLRKGDTLVKINQVPVEQSTDVARLLAGIGSWNKADYQVRRQDVEVRATVIVGERTPDLSIYYQYAVGAAYLAIGLFVWFRRASAPQAVHFFVLCLLSFVFSTFHYTGKLNTFDKFIYWGNVAAGLFAPAVFLHFCLVFPKPPRWLRPAFAQALLYVPWAAALGLVAGIATGVIRTSLPLTEVRWLLDRLWLPVLSGTYLAGALVLSWRYRRESDSVLRQQLKWLRNGALLGMLPFTALYVIPYTLGAAPGALMKMAVLSLGFIPLTWAYAIFRYRLMDVDVIFQQGYVYTLATLAVLGVIYGLSLGQVDDLNPSAVVVLILVATFVFQPIRNYIQELLDRHIFYKDSYNYRRTLVEFARELSSETDLERMLDSVSERLRQTLSVDRVGFFLAEPGPLPEFLPAESDREFLFFESPERVGGAVAEFDFTYYVPCRVRGRIIAWVGASRTDKGDFLSSDDLELLVTLSGSLGIAIENARLYRSLERKAQEYERLKEFSENIVESINVGILAADLDDRVESWNSRMEDLTGIARETAVGLPLSVLLPGELADKLDSIRDVGDIQHFDKHRLPTWNNKREATFNIAVTPLVSRDGARIGRLIIFDDITDRSELERRLVQADKLSSVGLLAAGVAHEVNTPLAVISTYAQMLAKQVNGDAQKAVLLEKIAKQTFRASEIVNSLLNFSRTSPTELSNVDLPRVIREVLGLIEHQLQKARVEVRLELPELAPAVRGNAGKLQQVFLNLFLNARDAMEDGGTLGVRITEDAGGAVVTVSDTGKGIAPEHLARIFDPFFTTKVAKKGTGLGLSVTYGIVQEHGGTIEVASEPGRGTEFRVTFPAASRAVAAPQPDAAHV